MSKHEQNAGPSRGRIILYSIAALFCLFGLADATYLTILALTGETAACSGQAGCQEVLGSAYARVAGIPVAAFGIAGYFTAFSCAIFAVFDYARSRKFFAIVVGVLFASTLWLLYVQAFLLHAFCRYCLFSAAICFLLMGLVVASPSPRGSRN
jgi:uncharacterized membrane protein